MHRTIYRIALAFAFMIALSGCKEQQVDVKGRVTYNGAPLGKQGGQIVFVGPNGSQVAASIGLDGTYLAAKVPAGLNRVAVYYPNPDASLKKTARKPPRGKAPPPPDLTPPPPPFLTPAKYASVDTSNLSVQVDTGTVFDTDLTGPKSR